MKLSDFQTLDYILQRYLKDSSDRPYYQINADISGTWYSCHFVALERTAIKYPTMTPYDGLEMDYIYVDRMDPASIYQIDQIKEVVDYFNDEKNHCQLMNFSTYDSPLALTFYLTKLIAEHKSINILPPIVLDLISIENPKFKLPYIYFEEAGIKNFTIASVPRT